MELREVTVTEEATGQSHVVPALARDDAEAVWLVRKTWPDPAKWRVEVGERTPEQQDLI